MASCPVVTFMPITCFVSRIFLSLDERDRAAMHGIALQVADLDCELVRNVTCLVSVVHDDFTSCESSVSLILAMHSIHSRFLLPVIFCSGRICFQNKVFVWAYEYSNEGSCRRLVWNSQYILRKNIYLFVSSLC